MTPDDPRDERLARLLGAVRADANPAVLARARARLAARATEPRVLRWLGRPAVLAGAGVLFALCVAGSYTVAQRTSAGTADASLVAGVLGDGDLGLPLEASAAGATGDSGEVTP